LKGNTKGKGKGERPEFQKRGMRGATIVWGSLKKACSEGRAEPQIEEIELKAGR